MSDCTVRVAVLGINAGGEADVWQTTITLDEEAYDIYPIAIKVECESPTGDQMHQAKIVSDFTCKL